MEETQKPQVVRPGVSEHVWPCFSSDILPRLTDVDDPALWEIAIDAIFTDANFLCRASNRTGIVAEAAACSHWLRPHQTRWTADGGFAWPAGYGGPPYSRMGLPEFEWSVVREWDHSSETWIPRAGGHKGDVTFRVTLPTRTARHRQAVAHTLWFPGSPNQPKRELLQVYGFRKKGRGWTCTAYRGSDKVYERAAEGG